MKEDTLDQAQGLMERVLERGKLIRALNRVKDNDGAPGVDGMRAELLSGYLRRTATAALPL